MTYTVMIERNGELRVVDTYTSLDNAIRFIKNTMDIWPKDRAYVVDDDGLVPYEFIHV